MQQAYYLIVNLGLGGGWPTDQTPSPSDMQVQYVRVYQQTGNPNRARHQPISVGQSNRDSAGFGSHDSSASQIVDSSGNIWTLGAAVGDGDYLILENGTQAGGGAGGVLLQRRYLHRERRHPYLVPLDRLRLGYGERSRDPE